ncbi:MAG: hypothetical protein LUD73_04585 [Lachnospiraceae bacterium]|nr:hypothetical protein [Lachnospiraceae bacterium]
MKLICKYVRCHACDRKIEADDGRHEQDECYEIDGYYFCEDCAMKYLRKEHYVRLSNGRR